MFKSKPKSVLKVIAVQTEVREFEDIEYEPDYRGFHTSRSKESKHKHPVTIVLLSRDGELLTREFNGNWNLEDIKSWEDLNGE